MGKRKVLVSIPENEKVYNSTSYPSMKLKHQILNLLRFKNIPFSGLQTRNSAFLISTTDPLEVCEALSRVPGVEYSAVVEMTTTDFDEVVKDIVSMGMTLIYPDEPFFVKVDIIGSLPYCSKDVEFAAESKLIGEIRRSKARIRKRNSSITLYARIEEDAAFVFYYRYEGLGGKPVGSAREALCVVSHNYESAVSAWIMTRQGVLVRLFLFDERPDIKYSQIVGAIKAATVVREFIPIRKYMLITLDSNPIFEELKKVCNGPLLPFIYERIKVRIVCSYANKVNLKTIIDSQSDLQVLENINEVSSSYGKQFLFPLIGLNTGEIVDYAKKIDVLNFSGTETKVHRNTTRSLKKADWKEIEILEAKLNVPRIVEDALKRVRSVDLRSGCEDIHEILNDYFRKDGQVNG